MRRESERLRLPPFVFHAREYQKAPVPALLTIDAKPIDSLSRTSSRNCSSALHTRASTRSVCTRRSAVDALKLSVFVEAQAEFVESSGVVDRPSFCKHRLEFSRMAVAAEREGVGLVGAQFTRIAYRAGTSDGGT